MVAVYISRNKKIKELEEKIKSLEMEVAELKKYKQRYEEDELERKAIKDFEDAVDELEERLEESESFGDYDSDIVPVALKVKKSFEALKELLNLKDYKYYDELNSNIYDAELVNGKLSVCRDIIAHSGSFVVYLKQKLRNKS